MCGDGAHSKAALGHTADPFHALRRAFRRTLLARYGGELGLCSRGTGRGRRYVCVLGLELSVETRTGRVAAPLASWCGYVHLLCNGMTWAGGRRHSPPGTSCVTRRVQTGTVPVVRGSDEAYRYKADTHSSCIFFTLHVTDLCGHVAHEAMFHRALKGETAK